MRDATYRPFAVATAAAFLISCLFPVVAAFVKDTQAWPKWWGALDVGLAFILAASYWGFKRWLVAESTSKPRKPATAPIGF